MNPKPYFAVVLCSHNGARFIGDQIQSILDQDVSVDVIHVHDFNSCDATREILHQFSLRDSSRLVITLHDQAPGPAESFLIALRTARPMLPEEAMILLADQDDIWLPHKLRAISEELVVRELVPSEAFLFFHDVKVVGAALEPIRPTYYTGNPFRVPRDLDKLRLMMANPAIGHTMLLSGSIVKMIAAWPNSKCYLMHDWLAMLVASRIGQINYIDATLSMYRQHGGNVLGAYRTSGRIASLSKLFAFVDRMITQAMCFSRALQNELLAGAHDHPRLIRTDSWCRQGYRRAALALSWSAIIYGPTWQRKAIALLLLARAIAGPAAPSRK